MHNNYANACEQSLPQPVALTSAETKLVSGGGSNVQHGNPGGGPAP